MHTTIDAHICQGGNIAGYIRKYPAIFCSICMARKAVDLVMQEKDIDSYNKKVIEERKVKMIDDNEPIEVSSYSGTPINCKNANISVIPCVDKCAICGKFEMGITVWSHQIAYRGHLCFNCIDQIKERL